MAARRETPVRKKKLPTYKTFRLSKRIKPPTQKRLSSVRRLIIDTFRHMWRYKRLFLGIILVYIILNVVFVKGLGSSVNVTELRTELSDTLELDGALTNATLLGIVLNSGSTAATSEGGIYQMLIAVFTLLALIWAFRQTMAEPQKTPQIRSAFYESTGSLVPFLLVLVVIGLQLLPMVAGFTMYAAVQANGLAVNALEQVLWLILTALLVLFSFYMLSSSLFALIIVTLPNMRPLRALKDARKVVAFRRGQLVRKLFALSLLVVLFTVLLLLIIIMVLPPLAEWAVILIGGVTFAVVTGVGYKLYRELL